MKLYEAIEELTGKLRRKVSYTDIAIALDVTRQYANQIKDKELSCEQLERLDKHFDVNLASANTLPKIQNTEDCISIPVLGEVSASMGYGVTVYNEVQTAIYSISRQLAKDLGVSTSQTEMIFAQGDSMMPTIEGGDSLLVDHARKEIYDGKIYCVRIDGQLYAKRLQKIPPDTVVIVSDNPKYRSFEIDLRRCPDYDFEVIGEIRWWGRVAR
ncbi:MAG: S24 family peptidase [Candidatus Gastranaerophilaceae bacterium]|jgi:26 kDa repressor protein|uniref:Helix-turn-helix transcriptional regulator n=1 Tax=Candidatus Limenecus avicola TaxID=2840847 RepID=A0A9D1N1C9_9CLOT|nr:helix-turn-helix transcriptional regulator [Clostridium sp.]CDC19065.1 phage transcriptional regulator [Clostridium sp. CAG:306]HIU93111.1 helix-turn-helix transcriptional regulator [Candidatus Limenecus avicola]